MPRLISLSQAARMVGVKRSELQNRIQSGELRTFEGAILLSDLLHAYPHAEAEDSSMLERVGEIMEQAVGKVIRPDHEFPDITACTNRIQALNRELAKARSESRRYRELLENLKLKLQDLDREEGGRTRHSGAGCTGSAGAGRHQARGGHLTREIPPFHGGQGAAAAEWT
jgi:hypothetical protein